MATITISFDINDENQTRFLSNFNGMVGMNITTMINSENINYKLGEKTEEETNMEFGKRCIKDIVFNTMKAFELSIDSIRYNEEQSAISPISSDLPDDLLT